MERSSDRAIEIIDQLHTERLDYESEYLPLIDCANKCSAYEDTGLEPEEISKIREDVENGYLKSTARRYGIPVDRLRELAQADREGRCVVLPVPLHKTLLDISDPYRPELMKDFRISATWTHRGIVFHSPWDIFLENIESGYIRVISAEAEAALRREQDG